MTQHNEPLEGLLAETIESLRNEALEPSEEQAIAERVRQRLNHQLDQEASAENADNTATGDSVPSADLSPIHGCDGYQAEIPEYLAGHLNPSRALLLEDHTRECIPCRRALMKTRAGEISEPTPQESQQSQGGVLRWAAAAALVVGVGLVAWTLLNIVPLSWGQTASIQKLEGNLYQLTRDGYLPLSVGQEIPYGTPIRSAKDSGAVIRLEDGSEIEMSARAEMELHGRRKGTIIALGRGNIIVEAAKQRDGKLFVETEDCEVSVTGTIFSVNHGTKGSRVSVVEGSVVVDYGAQEAVLAPGQQVATHASLAPVPVAREIAWSRNIDEYLALLRELNALRQEIDEALEERDLRFSSQLLNLMPADTTFYAAMPNLSGELSRGYEILQDRIESSPVLRSWWEQQASSEENSRGIESAMEKVSQLGEFLGEEVAFSFAMTQDGEEPQPLLLAQALDGNRLRTYLEQEIAAWPDRDERDPGLVFIDDPFNAPQPEQDRLWIWVREDLVAISPSLAPLRQLAHSLALGGSGPFTSEAFHGRLAEAYSQGVDWLVGADLSRLVTSDEGDRPEILESLGILDVRYLVLERKPGTASNVHQRAELSFDGPRRGLASWLAEPAPMASLEYISRDANLAFAALVKEPELLVDDLFQIFETTAPQLRQSLEEFERQHGVSVVEDFAAPLGGEIAIAIDGPLLPTPSWKVVLEVYDAPRLQNSLQWLVDQANQHLQMEGSDPELGISLEPETAGGQTFYALRNHTPEVELHYTFSDGYILVGPSRALLERALQIRESGATLTRSAKFAALLPQDGHAHFSGLSYQNLGSVLGPLTEIWNRRGPGLTADQKGQVQELVEQTPASLACAYGDGDSISFVANSEDSFLSGLLGLAATLGFEDWMEDALLDSPEPGSSSSSSPSLAAGQHGAQKST
ncbi:MAG: FecR family protein [Deltaproteobacteria bacterium]|nr:FecR family protein [Deltaproteobacteria bacterium]